MSSGRVVSAVTAATAMVALSSPPAVGQVPTPPSTSTPSVTTPSVSVEAPSLPVQTPPVQVAVPSTTVQAPTVTAQTPVAPVRSPSATVTTPSAKVTAPSTTATSSGTQVRTPTAATTTAGATKTATGSSAADPSTASSGQRASDRPGASGSAAANGSSRADTSGARSRAGGPAASASRRGGGDGGSGGGPRRSGRGGDGGGERSTPAERDRRLRSTVRGLEPCLSGLPKTERRVLALRAGVGTARSRSRGEVARITGLSRRRVRRAETAGLRHLRRMARTSSCDAAPATEATRLDATMLAADVARPAIPGLGSPSVATAFAGATLLTGAEGVPGIGVLAERRLSTPIPDVGSSSGSGPPIGPPDGGNAATGELSISLVAMMVLSCLALVGLRLRRTSHRDDWDPSAPW